MDVVWILIAVGALLVGIGIGYWLHACSPEVCKAKEDLEKLQEEYQGYRGQVDQHFNRSAELFQEMTLSYKAVYDHLSGGVQELCRVPGQQSLENSDPAAQFPGFGEAGGKPTSGGSRDEVMTPKVDEETETEWEANAATTPASAGEAEAPAKADAGDAAEPFTQAEGSTRSVEENPAGQPSSDRKPPGAG